MDFKKLFRKDDKAVSPVIGVILMVAITVILAAAIGSSVFSHGAAQAAPQANLNVKSQENNYGTGTGNDKVAVVKIEHLGGDAVNLGSESTKVLLAIDSNPTNTAAAVAVNSDGSAATGDAATGTLNIGDIKYFKFTTGSTPADVKVFDGQTAHIKFVDIKSGQIFLDKDVTF